VTRDGSAAGEQFAFRSSGNEHRDSGSKEEVKRLAIAVEEKRRVRIDLGKRTPADVAPSGPVLYATLTLGSRAQGRIGKAGGRRFHRSRAR
jgi:hypothetical protein